MSHILAASTLTALCVVFAGVFPTVSYVVGFSCGAVLLFLVFGFHLNELQTKKNNNMSQDNALLIFAYTCIPFFGAFTIVAYQAIASWPSMNIYLSSALWALTLLPGTLCFVSRYRLCSYKLLCVIPYVLFFDLASKIFAIIPAMMFGAPK